MNVIGKALGVRMAGAVLAVVACREPGPPPSHRDPDQLKSLLVAALAQTTLVLHTSMVRDTLEHNEPILLFYVITNGGPPHAFSNDPGLFSFIVETVGGERLVPRSPGLATRSFGRRTDLTIPARGALARMIDLRCIESGYSARAERVCDYGYLVNEPGVYRAITTYTWGDPTHRVSSQGFQLIDTLHFVIR
jgi:hypothetical protein